MNNLSIRDKEDFGSGLTLQESNINTITTQTYQVNIDSRDCIGEISLEDAKLSYELAGGRGYITGNVIDSTGYGISPIIVTLSPLSEVAKLKNGDKLTIKGVQGNENANGIHVINGINTITGQVTLQYTTGNGNFKGNGQFIRDSDARYPKINSYSNVIRGNEMIIHLANTLKDVRQISVDYLTIPRDIIPLTTWMPDFIEMSTNLENVIYPDVEINWSMYIPQEALMMEENMIGFYSTPLYYWRSYISGSFSMQDAVTPPPLELWNPPLGAWPKQPLPYPFQTVPTYQSNEFTIPGYSGTFHLVLSGYGVYDLNDWTSNTGVPVTDFAITSIVRKLLLLLICQVQSYNNVSYIEMILNCNTVTPGNYDYKDAFGYGDFQRFIPGPGIQLNYQPGSSDGADCTIANPTGGWTVPFPNFNGNVYGPYNYPGARFQKIGLRSVVQDLYLNGDLRNLGGNPIIKPYITSPSDLMYDSTFGLDFTTLIDVDLNSIYNAGSNLNIYNAMRIFPNGFGAVSLQATGSGTYFINQYQQASGQGPNQSGVPNAWANYGVYGGTGSLNRPIATGPYSGNLTPGNSDPTINSNDIKHQYAWSDSGVGQFINYVNTYIAYTINNIADTNLIIYIEEFLRNERTISTNNQNVNANVSIPMRLNLGTVGGTMQYIDSIYSLLSGPNFWIKRFYTPVSKINELHIFFETYDGQKINLEKMLQPRQSLQFLQLFYGIINDNIDILPELTNFNFSFLFNPYDPLLFGRMKRYLQLILDIQCYEYINLGLIPDSIGQSRMTILDNPNNSGPNTTNNNFATRSDPYSNYP